MVADPPAAERGWLASNLVESKFFRFSGCFSGFFTLSFLFVPEGLWTGTFQSCLEKRKKRKEKEKEKEKKIRFRVKLFSSINSIKNRPA